MKRISILIFIALLTFSCSNRREIKITSYEGRILTPESLHQRCKRPSDIIWRITYDKIPKHRKSLSK